MMKTEIISVEHPTAYNHAADILNHGGLVAFPTDTVYGLAALPFQELTVESLYVAKGRNTERAIAILLGDISQVGLVAEVWGLTARRLAEQFWPGPLTMIVPRLPGLPESLSPSKGIGVRLPDHPVALKLLELVGPLAVTSANLSGQDNTNTAREVFEQLQGRIHLILEGGPAPGGIPSTVVDCTEAEVQILRNGPINSSKLQAVIAGR
jgi:L-threonylcarbamoyladenylate synthase